MEIPFIGGAYSELSLNANAQRCVNLFPKVDNQNPKNSVTLSGTPGLVELSDILTAQYAILFENLELHYGLDETSGLAFSDGQGNYSNGTLVGFADDDSQWVTGVNSNGLYFGGTPEYGNTNSTFSSVLTSNFSIAMWVKMDDGIPSSKQYLIGVRDQPGAYYTQTHISVDTNGQVSAYYGNQTGGANFTTLNPPFSNGPMGTYKQIVATFEQDGTDFQITVYIDSVAVAPNATLNGSGSGISMSSWNSTRNLYLGSWNDRGSAGNGVIGAEDEVRIFSEALSQEKVTELYIYDS